MYCKSYNLFSPLHKLVPASVLDSLLSSPFSGETSRAFRSSSTSEDFVLSKNQVSEFRHFGGQRERERESSKGQAHRGRDRDREKQKQRRR